MKDNKWVLVTGGSRGIGKGICEFLFSKGFIVIYTCKNTKAEQTNEPGAVYGYQCDGADLKQVERFAGHVIAEYGHPFAIINNAGITQDNLLLQMTPENWNNVISNNLNASFNITKTFLPGMIENRGGVIVQISSVSAFKGNVGQTNYGASKAALIGFTKSLALEVARFNIRVNTIAPGFIQSDMVEELPEKEKSSLRKQIPLRRIGKPDDVAGLVGFLLTEDASYITGHTFVVDGGLTV